MVEFLLVVIAIGVLLLSAEGKALLNAAVGIATLLFFGGLALAIIGGIIGILYVGFTDNTAPRWMHVVAAITMVMGVLFVYGLFTAWWAGIWNKIKEKHPFSKVVVNRVGIGLDYFFMIFMSLVFTTMVAGISAVIGAMHLDKVFWIPISTILGIFAFYISIRHFLKANAKDKMAQQSSLISE